MPRRASADLLRRGMVISGFDRGCAMACAFFYRCWPAELLVCCGFCGWVSRFFSRVSAAFNRSWLVRAKMGSCGFCALSCQPNRLVRGTRPL
mmetsp:Transcript_3488/g.10785  ORF Transcript_3488/g.10785 Transcript_3488/m.10785 type:complete len:92 (+) Transcript_3488:1828-2103(+)